MQQICDQKSRSNQQEVIDAQFKSLRPASEEVAR